MTGRLGRRVLRLCSGALDGIGLDPRWAEAASGCAAALWGLWVLLMPGDLVDRPGYAPLGLFISDELLSGLFLLGGALQLVSVGRDHTLARIPVAAGMASAWFLVAYSVGVAAPRSPTIPILVVLGSFDGLAMLVLIHLVLRRLP